MRETAQVTVPGGLFYELWAALDVAAGANPVNEVIGDLLLGLGVAENIARVVVPHALFVPLLYGTPTGIAVVVIRRASLRAQETGGYS